MLRIELLGGFQAFLSDKPLLSEQRKVDRLLASLKDRSADRLLALLCLYAARVCLLGGKREISRNTLVEQLGMTQAIFQKAVDDLSEALTEVELVINYKRLPVERVLLLNKPRGCLWFDLDLALEKAVVGLDIHDFEVAWNQASNSNSEGDWRHVVSLYRGPLLDGWNEAWVRQSRWEYACKYVDTLKFLAGHTLDVKQRINDHKIYVNTLKRLSKQAMDTKEHSEAENLLQLLLEADPSEDGTWIELMDTLISNGKRIGAVRLYERACELYQQNDLVPPQEMTDLYKSILRLMPHGFPAQTTKFIGRERELGNVRSLLASSRILTLCGPGGIGKTRLAVAIAEEIEQDFPDAAWFADLSAVSDLKLLIQQVASAVGIRQQADHPLDETLIDMLRERKMLLVLDGCESLFMICGILVDRLLHGCPHLHILVTSRQPLNITGEELYVVSGLGISDAVSLFAQRAKASGDMPEIAEICRLLDGIPLAIELAAARVRALPPDQILEQLKARFLRTHGDTRALQPFQRLRTAFAHSYEHLTGKEQMLFRRLAVFKGGCTLESAQTICSDSQVLEQQDVPELLEQLVSKSFIIYQSPPDGPRYRLLEPLRQYALELFGEAPEASPTRDRHRDFFVAFAEQATSHLMKPQQAIWLDRLEKELDNFRLAQIWCQEDADGAELEIRLAAALGRFWWIRGYLTEGAQWLEHAITRCHDQRAESLAECYLEAGRIAWRLGGADSIERAKSLFAHSLAISEENKDAEGIAWGKNNLGYMTLLEKQYAEARPLLREALDEFSQQHNASALITAYRDLGELEALDGNLEEARHLLKNSIRLCNEIGGFKQGLADAHSRLGEIALKESDVADVQTAMGKLIEAETNFNVCLQYRLDIGYKLGTAITRVHLGIVFTLTEDFARARECFRNGLSAVWELRSFPSIALALRSIALLAVRQERGHLAAAKLLGASEKLAPSLGVRIEEQITAIYSLSTSIISKLGKAEFEAATSEGGSAPLEDIIDQALRICVVP